VIRNIAYQCVRCPNKHTAPIASALALLALCAECQAKRYAKGIAAQNTTPPPAEKQLGDH